MSWLSFGLGVLAGAVGTVAALFGLWAAALHRLERVMGAANE